MLASAAALASHLLTANLRDNPGARFEDQLDGTAARPYAYRVLAPALARTLEAALPASLCGRWESCAAALFEARGWPRQRACGYLAAFILMGAALLGYAWAARWLFGAVLVEPWLVLLALRAWRPHRSPTASTATSTICRAAVGAPGLRAAKSRGAEADARLPPR